MVWWVTKNQEKEVETLLVALRRTEKPVLKTEQKDRMRESLLYAIKNGSDSDKVPASMQALDSQIGKVFHSVKLPVHLAAAMKERILLAIEGKGMPLAFHQKHLRFMLTSFLLAAFVSTSVILPFKVPVTHAHAFIEDVSGEVYVKRDGRLIKAQASFFLQEGDKLITHSASSASVRFFDESLGRLGENTQMLIQKLSERKDDTTEQNVELYVDQGRIWAKVSDYSDDAHFSVKTQSVEAHVEKKASFDMVVDDSSTSIQVFDNVVDVVSGKEGVNKNTIVAGYEAKLQPEQEQKVLVAQLPPIDTDAVENQWVAENLSLDKKENIDRSKEAEKMFNDNIAEVRDVKETQQDLMASVILANDEVEQQKKAFQDAYANLLKAEGHLVRDNHQDGVKHLRVFRHDASIIIESLPELEKKDALSASVLRNLIAETLDQQKQDLSVFLPGDKLYNAKKIVLQMELLMAAPNTFDKAKLQLAQAEGKLLEVQELLKQKKESLALGGLREYQDLTSQIVIRFSEDQYPQVRSDFVGIMNQQIEQVKVLAAIEKAPFGTYSDDFVQEVSKVRDNTLKSLISSLGPLHDVVPEEDLKSLKDVFDTYLADSTTTEDFVASALQKALSDDSRLNFIDPNTQAVPSEVGLVVIESLESTLDAQVTPVVPAEETVTFDTPVPQITQQTVLTDMLNNPEVVKDTLPVVLNDVPAVDDGALEGSLGSGQ